MKKSIAKALYAIELIASIVASIIGAVIFPAWMHVVCHAEDMNNGQRIVALVIIICVWVVWIATTNPITTIRDAKKRYRYRIRHHH